MLKRAFANRELQSLNLTWGVCLFGTAKKKKNCQSHDSTLPLLWAARKMGMAGKEGEKKQRKDWRKERGMQDQKSRRGAGTTWERESCSGQESSRKEKKDGRSWGQNGLFVGVDVMALWGMCLQGAKGPQTGGTGGVERRSAEKEEEEGWGEKKQGLIQPPSFPTLSHTDTNPLKSLLPEVLLTAASHPRASWHNSPLGAHACTLLCPSNWHCKNCTGLLQAG